MSPKLALYATVLFIVYAFCIERRAWKTMPMILWAPLLWMLIAASRTPTAWLNPGLGGHKIEEGGIENRLVFGALLFVCILSLIKNWGEYKKLFNQNQWLLILFLMAGISILWSDYKVVAFKRYLVSLGTPLMAGMIVIGPQWKDHVKMVFSRFVIFLIPLSLVSIKYFPAIGRNYHRFTGELSIVGVTNGKNGLGVLSMISLLYILWLFQSKNRGENSVYLKLSYLNHFVVGLIAVWMLFKSSSMTAILCFFVGIGILFTFSGKRSANTIKKLRAGLYVACLLSVAILLLGNVGGHLLSPLDRDVTLTGRTVLWQELIKMNPNKFLGVGYGSFWLGEHMEFLRSEYWWNPNQAHNGYVETYLERGIVGLLVLGIFLYHSFVKINQSIENYLYVYGFRLAIFIVGILYNITESAMKDMHLIWFIMILVIIFPPKIGNGNLS